MLFLLSNLLSLCPHYTAAEMQGTVGRTPPQSAVRTKSRQAKAPTHTGAVSFLPPFSVIFISSSVPAADTAHPAFTHRCFPFTAHLQESDINLGV